jgi:hypothetical protein
VLIAAEFVAILKAMVNLPVFLFWHHAIFFEGLTWGIFSLPLDTFCLFKILSVTDLKT